MLLFELNGCYPGCSEPVIALIDKKENTAYFHICAALKCRIRK